MDKLKVGDWIYKISHDNIPDKLYKYSYGERGIFGRIIEINERYSPYNGKKRPNEYIIRAYFKNGKDHIKASKNQLRKAW